MGRDNGDLSKTNERHINYCPLVGTPSPCDLFSADCAIQSLILAKMQMRFSVERKSCLAPFCNGGLQHTSLLESMNAAVAGDLADLLNGAETASQVARDSRRHTMSELPPKRTP